jgi:hypothetical protein
MNTLRHPLSPTRLLAAAVFIFTAALYLRTTCPTLGGAFDSEEFQHVAYTLGIAHATGYPLYVLLGKIFTTLVPIGNVAYRMNVLSALISAGAASLVYLNAWQLTRCHMAAFSAAALFATNVAVWRQAGVASVGPLHLLLVAAIVYAMLLWHDKRASLNVAAFLFGLGLTHHRSTFLLALPMALLVLLDDGSTWLTAGFGIVRRARAWVRGALWLVLPLGLYLYMPIFGGGSPWYSNTLPGFIAQISGGDASEFMRTTPSQLAEGIAMVAQYLFDSFGYVGLGLIVIGAVSTRAHRPALFLGFCTILFSMWGALYAGEPDRYLVLPFAFLIYWFAIGVGAVENWVPRLCLRMAHVPQVEGIVAVTFAGLLALVIAVPFGDRFRAADWSTFDRVYKQWDEIFTLPIPRDATLVGNWGQLNAMRYLQRVENRRIDLQAIGTLYDPTPQTDAARAAFADGRAMFLAPGVALPVGAYRYALLGPLLEVRDTPQRQAPASAKNIRMNAALTLADFGITTALEPFAPTPSIAPTRTARVALTWQPEDSVEDFIVRLRFYDPEARLVAQRDESPVRALYPASQWQRGEYVNDVHNLLIPGGAPPGNYRLTLTTLVDQVPTSDEIDLAWLTIERATNLTREQVFIQRALDLALDERILLWGCSGCEGTYRSGEAIGVSLVWTAREDIGEDLTLHLALVDVSGRTRRTWQRAPIAFYPTRVWRKGEVLKAYYDLELLRDLPMGEASLMVGLHPQKMAPVGKIQIAP